MELVCDFSSRTVRGHLMYSNYLPDKSISFGMWVSTLDKSVSVDGFMQHYVPPLDVCMIWHTYLLNPA
jgi:hypothetical protein